MRTIEVSEEEIGSVLDLAVVEWNDAPEEVLAQIDKQLAEHGLEVVMYSAFDNAVSWKIEVREAR